MVACCDTLSCFILLVEVKEMGLKLELAQCLQLGPRECRAGNGSGQEDL